MSINTTQATGPANSSLVNLTAHRLSVGTLHRGYDPANNLGYGIGRIVRNAFDHLWHTWHKMWAVEPTSEELALQKQSMIFRNVLRECVQRLDAALDDVRKNPHDPSKLEKARLLTEHYALYLKFQERPELRVLQHKTLLPLEEKISQLTDPQIKNVLRQLLPVVFQEKSPIEETPDTKDTALLPLADSRIAKTKRAVQQIGVFSASFDLSTLVGTNGFAVNGLTAGDNLGYSVSTAGDLNGDGKADLVLGAEGADPGGRNGAGTAYVVFGQASGWPGALNLATLNGTNGFKVEGLVAGDYLGFSVSTAGDFNGDGKADLVLGAPYTAPGGRSFAGTFYVVFGKASGWPGALNLTTLNGTNGFKVDGLVAGDRLGYSVSTAGDVNGDGKADLVLGAHGADPGGRNFAGTAYVVFGQVSGWLGALNLTTLNGTNGFTIEGLAVSDNLGWSVSTAGDVNGDGKADLVLGAVGASPGGRNLAGTAYVVFGQASGWPGAFDLTTLNGTNGFKVEGLAAGDWLGASVSTAGDVNGDGKADLVLGAFFASPGGRTNAGTAYVVFGQASGWPGALNLTTLNGTNGFKVEGLVGGNYLGASVSTAGDVNGDGKADLVLGAYGADPGGRAQAGRVYVVFGQASGWPGALNLATLNGTNGFKVEGLAVRDWLGLSVSTAGDVNGDGLFDLLLGAPSNGSYVGKAYVIFGYNESTSAPVSSQSPSLTTFVSSIVPTTTIFSSTGGSPPVQTLTSTLPSAASSTSGSSTSPSSLVSTPADNPVNGDSPTADDPTIGIAAGIGGAVLLGAVAGIVAFLWRKKKACFADNRSQGEKELEMGKIVIDMK